MRSLLVALVCLAALVGQLAHARSQSSSREWQLYKRQHGKIYASVEEEARRFANFLTTKSRIERHNAADSNTHKLGLNHMADWTSDEFAKLNGLKIDESSLQSSNEFPAEHEAYLEAILAADDAPIPEAIDWRKVPGRVSPVKDQGSCGSCWAFSTTGLLEGQEMSHRKGDGKSMIPLSEQELMDCSDANKGCEGGLMKLALEDIKTIGGIESETDYPYRAMDRMCRFNRTKSVMSDMGAIVLPAGQPDRLKKLVAKYGPVSVAVYASENLKDYHQGVFKDRSCPEGELNHGVLVVGYGSDQELGDFWIVKNSWSKLWGEGGYFRIKRGQNMCGIESMATIAKF